MKRCQEYVPLDPFSFIPDDIFYNIHQNLSPTSRRRLSLLDKHRLAVCARIVKEICFLPPDSRDNSLEDVYQNLIARYPKIQKLTILSHRVNFKTNNREQILDFIVFLDSKKNEAHPLSHIKEMDIQEMKLPQALVHCSEEDLNNHTFLNHMLLSALSHAKLKSVTWRTFRKTTRLTGLEIQPILNKANSLKHFQVEGIFKLQSHSLSFKNRTDLNTIKLCRGILVDHVTISTLQNSPNLSLLNIEYSYRDKTEQAFTKSTWNLKHLTLSLPMNFTNLAFLEKMPHLEYLTLLNGYPTIHNLKLFKLREMRIEKLNLSEEKIATMGNIHL